MHTMKFELDDDTVLVLSSIGVGLYAAHQFVAPRHAHDTFFEAVSRKKDCML